ncbi:hypothetical protein C8Q73DRAFT_298781 [Cubamyces lactineus]|nr:hypothetical protein C8Q73DRAFT_298781 [Cubamyces lactineus]
MHRWLPYHTETICQDLQVQPCCVSGGRRLTMLKSPHPVSYVDQSHPSRLVCRSDRVGMLGNIGVRRSTTSCLVSSKQS